MKQDDAAPAISVILAVHDASATLDACLESVLAQTFEDFELICIDDASSDESVTLLERWRQADRRVIVLKNQANVGLGATRNRGVREARGRYVFHVDPDDALPAGALRALYASARKHGSDLVKGAYLREQQLHGGVAPPPRMISPCRHSDPVINTNLARMPELLHTTEGHWSCLYDVDLARRVPYPTDLRMGQDSMFIVSVLLQARKVTLIDEVVYHYRVNPDSAMNSFGFRKYMDALEWRRRAWHQLAGAGFRQTADRLLLSYWGSAFFAGLASDLSAAELAQFMERFRAVFAETGVSPGRGEGGDRFLNRLFTLILQRRDEEARRAMLSASRG